MNYVLTDKAVKNAKPKDKPYKLADGGNLYLYVSPTGAKSWRYKYRLAGKEGTFTIGLYPAFGLASAREEHRKSRQLVAQGIHPKHHRSTEKLKQAVDAATTFKSIATEWIAQNRTRWSPSYLRQVERYMQSDVYPAIGFIPIKQVTSAHLLKVMKDAESRGAECVAISIRQWCSAVFQYAVANLRADGDPAAALRKAVTRPKVKHHAALAGKDIPAFYASLKKHGGYRTTSIAIELLLLTFVRTVELRKAEWSEFSFEEAIWRIPADRMKMRTVHLVPLSTQVVALLNELKTWTGSRKALFPNYRSPSEHMTATTINRALERMGYGGRLSAHGFRSTASTLLHEQGIPSDVIERQLAHMERNKNKASYNFAEHMPERIKLMQRWADYVYSVAQGATVYNIKQAA